MGNGMKTVAAVEGQNRFRADHTDWTDFFLSIRAWAGELVVGRSRATDIQRCDEALLVNAFPQLLEVDEAGFRRKRQFIEFHLPKNLEKLA